MKFIKLLFLLTIFTSSVIANDESLVLSPYPDSKRLYLTKYNYVEYKHMRATDIQSDSFTKLISGEYYGASYILKGKNIHYSQIIKDYALELKSNGYDIHVNCIDKTCGNKLLKRFANTDSYRYKTYQGHDIFNNKSLAIISASKIQAGSEIGLMVSAKLDYQNNLKIAYEQISSIDLPKANIKVNDSYQVNLLDYKKLKTAKKDVKGGQDHPLITRFPSAYITKQSVIEFEEYPLILDVAKKKPAKKSIAGKVTTMNYEMDKKLSPLLVWKNYEQALIDNEIDIIFQCKAKTCGNYLIRNNYDNTVFATKHGFDFYNMDKKSNYYFFSAVKKDDAGDIYLTGYFLKRYAHLPLEMTIDIVETKPLTKVNLNVASEKLNEEIKSNGRVSLYGIEFDYDKATLKKGSEPQLNEIAKFLKGNREISIYVVGHTDNKGSYQYNQSLSEKRANTIVDTLSQKYQIKPDRLHAIGIGPVSPDAANNTMKNMQKNRRVELVLKSPLYL